MSSTSRQTLGFSRIHSTFLPIAEKLNRQACRGVVANETGTTSRLIHAAAGQTRKSRSRQDVDAFGRCQFVNVHDVSTSRRIPSRWQCSPRHDWRHVRRIHASCVGENWLEWLEAQRHAAGRLRSGTRHRCSGRVRSRWRILAIRIRESFDSPTTSSNPETTA